MTHLPHVLLASRLNSILKAEVDNLHMKSTLISSTSSHGLIQSVGLLIHRLGWKQVSILANAGFVENLGRELAKEDICVVDKETLPNGQASKDEYTGLLSGMTEFGVDKVVVAGAGKDIARLVRNLYELNLSMSLVVIPFDGPVADMPGSDYETVDVIQLVPTYYEMPEFMSDYKKKFPKDNFEHPLSLQIAKAVYGVMVVLDESVDEKTTREGLRLTREMPRFRIEKLDVHKAQWQTIGVYEEGDVSWNKNASHHRNRPPHILVNDNGCEWCKCLNGAWREEPSWRWETWATVLATVSGLGILGSIVVCIFFCTQCGQVLEGAQGTTLLLLSATVLLYLSVLPFNFHPGELVCAFRALTPAATYTFAVSIMLSRFLVVVLIRTDSFQASSCFRSFLLATADSDGLPGHASGCIQLVLLILLLCVEGGVLLEGFLSRADPFLDVKRLGRFGRSVCNERGWLWLSNLVWPGALLCIQTSLAPFIWKSRRNYKEGVLFSLASLACCLVTGGWVAVYLLCSGEFRL